PLRATLPPGEPAVVVRDNASYPKSLALREPGPRLAQRLPPFFLPAYAPHLHLSERRWRSRNDQLASQRWGNDLDRLMEATTTLLADREVPFQAHDGRPAFQAAHH